MKYIFICLAGLLLLSGKVNAETNNQPSVESNLIQTPSLDQILVVSDLPDITNNQPQVDTLYINAMKILNDKNDENSEDIQNAILCLKESAEKLKNPSAIEVLADISLFGNFTNKPDFKTAKYYYNMLAEEANSSKAHFYLAFLENSGIFGLPNKAKALIHLHIAAVDKHPLALGTLSYKYKYGITVNKNTTAYMYYAFELTQKIAEEPIYDSYPHMIVSQVNLLENEIKPFEQIYKPDFIKYYDITTKQNPDILYAFGLLYYVGSYGTVVNYQQAKEYFEMASKDGHSESYGYLGEMYRRGKGVNVDLKKALVYYRQGMELNSGISYNGLGIMYLYGIGVEKNVNLAIEYLKKACKFGSIDAYYHLGKYHMVYPDKTFNAVSSLRKAAVSSHIRGIYEYCKYYFKNNQFLDKGAELRIFLNTVYEKQNALLLVEAFENYKEGNIEMAKVKYMIAAYTGSELAQKNTAWLLEREKTYEAYKSALEYWIAASFHKDVDSTIRVGDYYYYGYGVEPNYKTALKYYYEAELNRSAQAAFNMGYIYEHGIGVTIDYELSKRYYNRVFEHDSHAYFPAFLALIKLNMKMKWDSYWNGSNIIKPKARYNNKSFSNIMDQFVLLEDQEYAWLMTMWKNFLVFLIITLSIVYYFRIIYRFYNTNMPSLSSIYQYVIQRVVYRRHTNNPRRSNLNATEDEVRAQLRSFYGANNNFNQSSSMNLEFNEMRRHLTIESSLDSENIDSDQEESTFDSGSENISR